MRSLSRQTLGDDDACNALATGLGASSGRRPAGNRLVDREGLTWLRPLRSALVAALSFWLLGLALRQLPVGTAYAVWTGLALSGLLTLSVLTSHAIALSFIALIVCGILGLDSSAAGLRRKPSLEENTHAA